MLILYDTMPDGTGYLQSKEKRETVCCSCLKEFWNQYVHALLKRRLVDGSSQNLPLLSTIKPGRNEIDKARRFWRTLPDGKMREAYGSEQELTQHL